MIVKGKKYVVRGAWKDCGSLTDLFDDGDIVIPIYVDDGVAICILAEKYNEAEADELVRRYYEWEWESDVEDRMEAEIKQIVDVMGKNQLVLCEEEQDMKIIDIVEKAIKTGECGAMSIGCCQGGNIDCSRCPFDLYNNRDVLGLSNEDLKGCVSLSEEEIQKIARHYLENISK